MGGESDATFLDNLQHQSWPDLVIEGRPCELAGCPGSNRGTIRFDDMPDDIKRAVRLAKQVQRWRTLAEDAEEENERLTAWLSLIDGGDRPCHNAHTLQQYAHDALRGDAVPE